MLIVHGSEAKLRRVQLNNMPHLQVRFLVRLYQRSMQSMRIRVPDMHKRNRLPDLPGGFLLHIPGEHMHPVPSRMLILRILNSLPFVQPALLLQLHQQQLHPLRHCQLRHL